MSTACQQLFSGIVDSTPTSSVLPMDVSPMPYKPLVQLRLNVEHLLATRKETKADLAREMKIDPSTLTKFLNGTREIQFHHLEGMQAFFGLSAYELFRPDISPLTERRKIVDRRMGIDRRQHRADRLGHVPTPHPRRRLLTAAAEEAREKRQRGNQA